MTKMILETMNYAVPMALKNRKIMYVFKLDGDWGCSGKLPKRCEIFYIIYPDGSMDRSQAASDISLKEFEFYKKRLLRDEFTKKDVFRILCFCSSFVLGIGLYNLRMDRDGRFMGLRLYKQSGLLAVLTAFCACPIISAKESLYGSLGKHAWIRRAYASNRMFMAIVTILCLEHYMGSNNFYGVHDGIRHSSITDMGQ